MPELIQMITNKKVKDTAATSQATQEKNLQNTIQKVQSESSNLLGGIQAVIQNANNVISQSVSGITSSIKESVSNFSNTANNGLTTTLTDLTSKNGSMINDIAGNVNSGAVSQKMSFIADTANASILGTSLSGSNNTKLTGLLSDSSLSKISSSLDIPSINNDSSLKSAITSVSSNLNSFTSSAKSIVNDVKNTPKEIIGQVSNASDSLVNSITSSVTNLANEHGLGELNSIVKDVSEIYSLGHDVYDVVTGNDGSVINGITSKLNSSFGEIQSLLNLASTICSAMSNFDISNFAKNKDLYDLLLKRLADNGLAKALEDLLNCTDTEKYDDQRTYAVLNNILSSSSKKGDVDTVNTIHKYLGNGRTSNTEQILYDLAINMNDTNTNNIDTYSTLLSNTGIDSKTLIGTTYVDNNGNTEYMYSVSTIDTINTASPNLSTTLTGNSSINKLASALSTSL